MMPDVSSARPEQSITVSGAPSIIPSWAAEAAASAPRINATDAAPLLSIFGQVRPGPLAVAA